MVVHLFSLRSVKCRYSRRFFCRLFISCASHGVGRLISLSLSVISRTLLADSSSLSIQFNLNFSCVSKRNLLLQPEFTPLHSTLFIYFAGGILCVYRFVFFCGKDSHHFLNSRQCLVNVLVHHPFNIYNPFVDR